PRAPEADARLRPFSSEIDLSQLQVLKKAEGPLFDAQAAEDVVARAIDELHLPVYPVAPAGVFATVHESPDHRPALLFVLNPGTQKVAAQVSAPGGPTLTDLFTGTTVRRGEDGTLEVVMAPRSVRMLAFDRA